tara:strand:- start:30 stop:881 length:852 start_codon:yes stop_codon:yes gene_type:complete
MKTNDFIFSYGLIIYNFFFVKKKYLKTLKKILNTLIRFIKYNIKNIFSSDHQNIDNLHIKNKNFKYLFNRFNSDRAKTVIWGGKKIDGHNYTPFYEKYLKKYKNKKNLKILEIGSLRGSSATALYFYFLKPTIVCADISPFAIRYFGKKIRPIYIDTQSEKIIKKVAQYLNLEFDIIIDDGSHNIKDQIISFKSLYPYLKKGGTFIIEDLTCYKVYPFLNPDNEKHTTIDIFKSLKNEKKIHSKYLKKKDITYLKNNIKKINLEKGNWRQKKIIISDIVFVEK